MRLGKRSLDVIVGAAALLLVSPVLLVIATFIKAEDGADVFFRQERVGEGGRIFGMWKFRTMIPRADELGPSITASNDTRITRVGTWIRRRKLDELPQLINVLLGEMSLVGPRPEVPKYVALYTPEQRRVLELRPGITDRASILFADESELLAEATDPERFYVTEIMGKKIRINLEYASGATIRDDLSVIFETVGLVNPLRSFHGKRQERLP